MADSTVVNLTAVATPALTDLIAVRQSGDTRDKKETLAQLRTVVFGVSSFLAGNATNSTATMAATGLTVPVTSGHKYKFSALLKLSHTVPADGIKVDFDTSAAATDFWAVANAWDTGSNIVSLGSVALATDLSAAIDGSGNDGWFEISGSYEPSASGNFLIRFAEAAHTTGTATLYRGSSLVLLDVT